MHEVVRWVLRRLGHPPLPTVERPDDRYDVRLSEIERQQADIAARLRLLEYQADPRGRSRRG